MPLLSTTQPSLRARVLPRFPADVVAGSGITINKNGLTYTISAIGGGTVVSAVTVGASPALISGSTINLLSIPLTQGDWDVSAMIYFDAAAATLFTQIYAIISPSPSGFDGTLGRSAGQKYASFHSDEVSATIPTYRFIISPGGGIIYLNAFAVFTVSTMTAKGYIMGRRMG